MSTRVGRRDAGGRADELTILLTIPCAFAFYLLLAGALGIEQLVSAGIMTVVAVAWSVLLRVHGGPQRFAFTWAHAAPWARSVARIPADVVRIGIILARACVRGGSPGRAVRPGFRFGPVGDPIEAARRASAVVAGSLTPDTFVVDIEPGGATAACHKLAATPAPADRDWLA